MLRLIARCAFATAPALLAGCHVDWVREHPLGCRLDEQPLVRDTLYFGRSMPGGGEVDADAWREFETGVLLRAFPHGYTVLDATGRWRGADGVTVGEASRVVIVVHADDGTGESTVRDVVARYRSAFRQESVLRERAAVCASF
jgi:hypothetical protein